MRENYAKYTGDAPGPQDIFDYGIGRLWRQGIDGAGTTIAVLEGWNYPKIAQQVAGLVLLRPDVIRTSAACRYS
jgi:hypothetical protein